MCSYTSVMRVSEGTRRHRCFCVPSLLLISAAAHDLFQRGDDLDESRGRRAVATLLRETQERSPQERRAAQEDHAQVQRDEVEVQELSVNRNIIK